MSLALRSIFVSFVIFCFSGCSCRPASREYRAFYAHLKKPVKPLSPYKGCHSFLIVCVSARHLDYTDTASFFRTVAKHPSNASKNGDVGHAWIYAQGYYNGELCSIEGGHSGETGLIQPRYFDGVMNYNEYGVLDPLEKDCLYAQYEANPVRYLWDTQQDGFFQKGSGGHKPTFAIQVPLQEGQFSQIMEYITHYPFHNYAITGYQCVVFASEIAAIAGLPLDYKIDVPVQPLVYFGDCWIRLWEDPAYSTIRIGSPDVLEKSMMEAVRN